jgi:hypothetical protein
MDQHDRNQVGIMRLLARDQMFADEHFPRTCDSGFALQ